MRFKSADLQIASWRRFFGKHNAPRQFHRDKQEHQKFIYDFHTERVEGFEETLEVLKRKNIYYFALMKKNSAILSFYTFCLRKRSFK